MYKLNPYASVELTCVLHENKLKPCKEGVIQLTNNLASLSTGHNQLSALDTEKLQGFSNISSHCLTQWFINSRYIQLTVNMSQV